LVYDMAHNTLGRQSFATYHFLVRAKAGAPLNPLDASESIAAWRWTPAASLREVASVLDAVGERPAPDGPIWADWGHYRALSHRFVARQLSV
ncbi:MAG: hypothetical protein ACRC1H_05945, partial [Caldilineaceae bacterium]